MKILITGENGYITNQLYTALSVMSDKFQVQKESVRDDVNSMNLKDFDVIIHPAALVHKKEENYTLEEYYEVNTILTEKLAKQAKMQGVKQFIFLSTMAVYGQEEGEITTNTPLAPKSHYGKSKLAAEQKLQELEDDHFKVAIVRPPMVYGPDCPGNYTSLSKLSKKIFIFPAVENKRSMIFIGNLIAFVEQLLNNQDRGIFHIQDRQFINTAMMVKEIASIHKRKVRLSKVGGTCLRTVFGKSALYKKVFGSLYYSLELCQYRENIYQKYDFKTAIKMTEKKEAFNNGY